MNSLDGWQIPKQGMRLYRQIRTLPEELGDKPPSVPMEARGLRCWPSHDDRLRAVYGWTLLSNLYPDGRATNGSGTRRELYTRTDVLKVL